MLFLAYFYGGMVVALPVLAVVAGFIGRRYVWARYVLIVLGPGYMVGLSAFLVWRGYGFPGAPVVIGIGLALTLAPVISFWLGVRGPSVAAAVVLFMFSTGWFFSLTVLVLFPAFCATLAAAIAGPPLRRPATSRGPSSSARLDASV